MPSGEEYPPPVDMLDAIETCIKHDAFEKPITEWEENFVISMQERRDKKLSFTPNMVSRLREIYDKT